MRKLAILLSVFVCLGVVAVIMPTEVSAQLRPCCEGGFKPDKPCQFDDDCQDICEGGFRDGKPCSTSPCHDACVGGAKDGENCLDGDDAKCPDACVGGSKDGQGCTSDANCPGGTCSNIGTCANEGTCLISTCTGLCEKKRPKPTPSEPVSVWDAVSQVDNNDGSSPRPCP